MALIDIRRLTYSYPGSSAPALVNLDLQVPEGQFCALVGPNGAGKSTLCHLITGFVPHFHQGELQGTALVGGMDVASTSLESLVEHSGLVLDDPFNQITGSRFTVREEVAFGLENLGIAAGEIHPRVDEALRLTGIEPLADRSPYALSGGEQQRLAIASLLAMRPKLMVLDEPTSQLDPAGSRQVLEVLASLVEIGRTTVFIAEHKLEWLALHADRAILLNEGKILADGPARQVLSSAVAEQSGVQLTRYTLAAQKVRAETAIRNREALPVTLEQAVSYFG